MSGDGVFVVWDKEVLAEMLLGSPQFPLRPNSSVEVLLGEIASENVTDKSIEATTASFAKDGESPAFYWRALFGGTGSPHRRHGGPEEAAILHQADDEARDPVSGGSPTRHRSPWRSTGRPPARQAQRASGARSWSPARDPPGSPGRQALVGASGALTRCGPDAARRQPPPARRRRLGGQASRAPFVDERMNEPG